MRALGRSSGRAGADEPAAAASSSAGAALRIASRRDAPSQGRRACNCMRFPPLATTSQKHPPHPHPPSRTARQILSPWGHAGAGKVSLSWRTKRRGPDGLCSTEPTKADCVPCGAAGPVPPGARCIHRGVAPTTPPPAGAAATIAPRQSRRLGPTALQLGCRVAPPPWSVKALRTSPDPGNAVPPGFPSRLRRFLRGRARAGPFRRPLPPSS